MVGAHAFPPYVEDDGLFVPHFCLFCFSKLYLCISVGPFLLLLNEFQIFSPGNSSQGLQKSAADALRSGFSGCIAGGGRIFRTAGLEFDRSIYSLIRST